MTSIDINLKPKNLKLKNSKTIANNSQNRQIEMYNNEERKNYFKNISPKKRVNIY